MPGARRLRADIDDMGDHLLSAKDIILRITSFTLTSGPRRVARARNKCFDFEAITIRRRREASFDIIEGC